MLSRDLNRKKHVYSVIERDEFEYFDVPIFEEWYEKKIIKKKYIPKKPEWIKLKYKDGVPYLSGHYKNVWEIRPITQKVYDIWLYQMLRETKTNDQLSNRC